MTITRAEELRSRGLEAGDDAARVVLLLKEQLPSLEILSFKTYTPSAGFVDRMATPKNAREEYRAETVERQVTEMLRHDADSELGSVECVEAGKVSSEMLRRWSIELSRDQKVLALCSRTRLKSGEWAHIPMMDFKGSPSVRSEEIVSEALRRVGRKIGILLESGRSYHFYGVELLSEAEWKRFMALCLLMTPYTDSRYIGHRLLTGLATLRVSSCEQKPFVPRVVRSWGV